MIPGLSKSSNPLLLLLIPEDPDADTEFLSVATRIHWRDRVTPGVLAVLARLRPRSRLIRADWRM